MVTRMEAAKAIRTTAVISSGVFVSANVRKEKENARSMTESAIANTF